MGLRSGGDSVKIDDEQFVVFECEVDAVVEVEAGEEQQVKEPARPAAGEDVDRDGDT